MIGMKRRYEREALANWPELAQQAGIDPTGAQVKRRWVKLQKARHQIVLQLALADEQRVILKQIFRPSDQTAFGAMVKAQKVAWQLLPDRFGAPNVLADNKLHQLFLMEDVAGEDLFQKLNSDGDHAALLSQAGAWLSAYHNATFEQRREFRPSFMARHLEKLAKEAEIGVRRVPDPAAFALSARIFAVDQELFAGQETVIAARHGDYNLRNILVGGAGVQVIDFSPTQMLPVGYDIARLLLHYMLIFGQNADLPAGQVISREAEDAFFDGYKTTGPDDPSYRFLTRVRLMQEWNVHYPVTRRQYLRNRQRYKRIRALVSHLMDSD